jgi:hypothetical protein
VQQQKTEHLQDIGAAELGNYILISYVIEKMAQIDEIEDILMEAYAYGIQHEVLDLAKTLLPLNPYNPVTVYEQAFNQTMSRYE